jgi:hypothetical protein
LAQQVVAAQRTLESYFSLILDDKAMELLGGPDAPIPLKNLEFLPEGLRQHLIPGVRYLDFKAVVARPNAMAPDRAYA